MSIKDNCILQLKTQVFPILEKLNPQEYKQPLLVLSGSSIGQHIRHVLEFFQCLIASEDETVNYDKRARNMRIENDLAYAKSLIIEICDNLETIPKIKILQTEINNEIFKVTTSLERELSSMIEHVVHHLAIIKSGFLVDFKHIQLPKDFGYAQSTIKHKSA